MRTVWTEITKFKRIEYKKSAKSFYTPSDKSLAILSGFIEYCDSNTAHFRCIGDTVRASSSEDDVNFLRRLMPQDRACVLVFGLGLALATLGLRSFTEREWQDEIGACQAPQPFIIERRRADHRQKALAIGVGSAFRILFGKPFIRTTATLLGVITGEAAPHADRVREWLRVRP